jgi:hypothetical protein
VPRIVTAIIVVAAVPLWGAAPLRTPSNDVPRDPCTVLTRTQVQQLLVGSRVVTLERRHNSQNRAVECTWRSGFFQTKALRRAHEPFSMQVTVQPTATATAALEELRARVQNPTNETTNTVPNLGDEAYLHLGDVIVVSGDLVMQVALTNYDTTATPYPSVDDIARRAAALVVRQLRPPASKRASGRAAELRSSAPIFGVARDNGSTVSAA